MNKCLVEVATFTVVVSYGKVGIVSGDLAHTAQGVVAGADVWAAKDKPTRTRSVKMQDKRLRDATAVCAISYGPEIANIGTLRCC